MLLRGPGEESSTTGDEKQDDSLEERGEEYEVRVPRCCILGTPSTRWINFLLIHPRKWFHLVRQMRLAASP